MDNSSAPIKPVDAFKDLSPRLIRLKSELSETVVDGNSIAQIDDIVNRAFEAFSTAHQMLGGNRSELQLPRINEKIREISYRKFFAQQIIQDLIAISNKISVKLICQSNLSLSEIQQVSKDVNALSITTQQRAEALSKKQELIQDRIRLLQEKKGVLTAFRTRCEELSQIFAQICSRTEVVNSSLATSSSHIDESDSRVSLSVQKISGIVQDLNAHMEELSRVEGELGDFSSQVAQHAHGVDQNDETVSGLAKEISELQSGFAELQTSMVTIGQALAIHRQQTNDGTVGSSNSEVNNIPPSPIDGELTWTQRLFIWTLKAIFWYKKAYNHTSLELSIAMNSTSQWTKHQITPYVGVYQATVITNPKLWVATVLFILYWKGVLRKAAGCYMLGCAIFHARARPMIENQP